MKLDIPFNKEIKPNTTRNFSVKLQLTYDNLSEFL